MSENTTDYARNVGLPVFAMARAWVADHLSDPAVAFLARAAAALPGETLDVADDVLAEITAAGLFVDGQPHDPGTAAWRARAADFEPPAPRPNTSVVYYLRRRSDGAVKIGWSQDVDARCRRLAEVYGDVELLCTEPGGWSLEQQRHDQFERLRLPRQVELEGGSEWFREGAALRMHWQGIVAAAREAHGVTAPYVTSDWATA